MKQEACLPRRKIGGGKRENGLEGRKIEETMKYGQNSCDFKEKRQWGRTKDGLKRKYLKI